MEVETLKKRCLRIKKLLEDYVAEVSTTLSRSDLTNLSPQQAADKEYSIEWFRKHNEIVAFYLETALIWLKDGHTTYQRTLPHPISRKCFLFESGTKISDKLNTIEAMLELYGVELSDPEEYPPSSDTESATRKRKASEDSGIGLNGPRKKRRPTPLVLDKSDLFSVENAVIETNGRPRRERHVKFADESLVEYLEDEEADPTSPGNPNNDDEEYQGDTEDEDQTTNKQHVIDSPRSLRPRAATSPASASSLASANSPASLNSPTSPNIAKSPRTRPPRLEPAKSRPGRKGKCKASPKTLTTPTQTPSGLTWLGHGRPAHMPSIPCPGGLNPVVWDAMSYRSQKTRLEGLRLLAEMPSEESEWETSDDEDD
jgi:hypothetical protein